MRVSVVIPTYNRAGLLRRTLPALVSQKTEPFFTYEVILVSNGSSDETPAVLEEAGKAYPHVLRWFHIAPTGGPSAPRNRGIREAKGDVVVIMDDDVLPDGDLVLRHAEFHRDHPEPEAAAIGEAYVPADLGGDPMSLFHTFPYDEVRGKDRLGYLHFWTCNVSFKRQFMLDHGMFDETFLYYEDVLVGHALESGGMHLRFEPRARGQHLHQLKPAGVASKGRFTGLWLHAFLERVPDRAARIRFGVLSRDLPPVLMARRVVNRAGFAVVASRPAMALMRLLGAENGRRSRVSDLYYYALFRKNMLDGYAEAKREARQRRNRGGLLETPWADRGES